MNRSDRKALLPCLFLGILPICFGVLLLITVTLIEADGQNSSDDDSNQASSAATVPISEHAAAIATIRAAPERPPASEAFRLLSVQGQFFDTSGVCAACHTNLKDQTGKDVSIDTMWRSTMMANSGRDPYWRAGLRREVLSNPSAAEFIQDKCSTCHMPMGRTTVNLSTGDYALVFGETGMTQTSHPYHDLAMDSISCALCHQITDTHLGEYEGFSGHYTVDATAPDTARVAYGPFEPIVEQVTLMQNASGFVQSQSAHIQTSQFCASCHELYTPYFNVETRELAPVEFAEQTPYSEWLYSEYQATDTCQSCHMPVSEGLVAVASVGDPAPRPDYSQHVFVGGNVYMLRVFQQFSEELNVTATDAQFQNTIDATRHQLQNDTATLTLENVVFADGTLSLDAVIQSLVGHKLPASYPSRRAWLHVTILDANGNVVFESGGYNTDGSIIGNDNDVDGLTFEPHYDTITDPAQVQIYEPIMGDTSGNPTTVLLLASVYLKDNRLLPAGYDKSTVPPEIGVYGDAAQDEDFVGGGDRVTYQVALGDAQGPFTIQAELVYQTIGYRWANNLREFADPAIAPEIVNYLAYYEAVPNIPELIANATMEIQ